MPTQECHMDLAVVLLSTVIGTMSAPSSVIASETRIVIPATAAFGEKVSTVPLILGPHLKEEQATPPKDVFPVRLTVDIRDGRVEGLVALYPEEVELKDVVTRIRQLEADSKAYPDLEKHRIWVWRNEKERYSIQVSLSDEEGIGPQLVAIWLDRKSPPGELAVEATKSTIAGEASPQENDD